MTDRPMIYNYVKVDGPPDCWCDLEVVDRETGKHIPDVVEVNADEGWFVRHVMDPETGNPVLEGVGDDRTIKTERVEQPIRIQKRERP